jgi:hypothetical protein
MLQSDVSRSRASPRLPQIFFITSTSFYLPSLLVLNFQLPVFYALRLERSTESDTATGIVAFRIKCMTDPLSGAMMTLLLPLGVYIATHISVYLLTADSWLYATWAVGAAVRSDQPLCRPRYDNAAPRRGDRLVSIARRCGV